MILRIISRYTAEAGVRELERKLAAVCRGKAYELATSQSSESTYQYSNKITERELDRYLGIVRTSEDKLDELLRPGVVHGLAYHGSGNGGLLTIEVVTFPCAMLFSSLPMTQGSWPSAVLENYSAQYRLQLSTVHRTHRMIGQSGRCHQGECGARSELGTDQ